MAIVCSICHKKQSGFLEDYPLSDARKDMRICATCHDNFQTIEGSTNIEAVSGSIRYFESFLRQGAETEVVKTINAAIDGYHEKLAADQPAANQPVLQMPINPSQPVPPMGANTVYQPVSPIGMAPMQPIFNNNEPKVTLKETIYGNIGNKIKSYAAMIFVIQEALVVILSLLLIFSEEEFLLITGIVVLILGTFVSFVSTWLLYAFGELVDKTSRNEENTREILKFLTKNNIS